MEAKKYPLSPSQQLLSLSRQASTHKALTNVPTYVIVDDELDQDLLEKALRIAISRWDVFGLRFYSLDSKSEADFGTMGTVPGKGFFQTFGHAREPVFIKRKDFRGSTQQQMDAYLSSVGSKPLKFLDAPQAGFIIFNPPQGGTGIFSVFSHFIMDSWGISVFNKDVIDIYKALETGQPLPKEMAAYEDTLETEFAYASSERAEADKEFWDEELGAHGEPMYTDPRGAKVLELARKKAKNPNHRTAPTFFLRTKAAHHVQTVDAEVVKGWQELLGEVGVPSMQVLLQVAMRIYLGKVCNTNDVSMYLALARRGTLKEKFSGGSRVQVIFFRTILEDDLTFKEALQQVLLKQDVLVRHGQINSLEIFRILTEAHAKPRTQGYISTGFTFQPLPMDVGYGMKTKTQWYCTGAAGQILYLTVMDHDGTGGLRFYYEYLTNLFTESDIAAFHAGILGVLQAAIKNPDATIAELKKA